jgi:hypothetical protein
MHLAPLFGIRLGASDSSETREEPLSYSIDGFHSRLLRQPRLTRCNVKAQKVLHSGETGVLDSEP